MSNTIFAVQHDAATRVGVTSEPLPGKGSLVVSVYRTGAAKPQRWRFVDPAAISRWFEQWSPSNVLGWHMALVRSKFDILSTPESSDVEADVKPRLVPYHSQRNNEIAPGGTCNVTSYAMVLDFYDLPPILKAKPQLEDNLSLWMQQERLDRHDHNDLVRMGRAHGLDVSFDTNVTLSKMRDSLVRGHILVVSGKFTSSGHIVCVYGTHERDFRVNDPWGAYDAVHGGRHYRNSDGSPATDGAHRVYSAAVMQDVLIGRRPSGAWVHTIKGRAM